MIGSAVRPESRLGARDWLILVGICALALSLAASGLGTEGAVSLDGDMPRYLMNGVFLRDLLHDFPIAAPLAFAEHYYARYPALSLGHHPILPAVAQMPFFLVFGVSVFAARLSVLTALVVTILCWFRFVRSVYDTPTAAFAALLLVTTAGFIPLYRVVLSEPYTLCLIMTSLYAMHRYTQTEDRRYAIAFVVSAIASAYAKQLAVMLFPVYAFQLASAFGVRRLVARPTLIVAALMAVAVLPLVALTLKYSQFNVMIVTQFVGAGQRMSQGNLLGFIRRLVVGPFGMSPAMLALAAIGALAAAWRRDQRAAVFVVWIVSAYAALLALAVGNERFACYWLAAFAALGASTLQLSTSSSLRLAIAVALAALVGYQGVRLGPPDARERGAVRLSGGAGYEEAARLVTADPHGDTVLYSAQVDSGYFTFFVRKHDPRREMVVLRADKTLTTSRMGRLDFERRTQAPEEVLPTLKKFGVGYLVIETHPDRPYPQGPLQWLQETAWGPEFSLVSEIPVGSTDRRLKQATLSIYRYKGEAKGDPDASISINVPAMNELIAVRLSELTANRVRP